ncbi:MAG TPA: glutamate carboxypeptidase [Rhodanobacteraceae bacterium]
MEISRKSLSANLLLLSALACGALAHASAADPSLFDAARAEQPAVIATLGDLVSIESGSADREGLERMATYLETRLQKLGAKVTRVPSRTGGPDLVSGTITGPGELKVLLIAHMDTVYDQGILATESYRRDGNLLYGPGIADDKGGIAVILHSLALLRGQGWNNYAQITVLFNPDEEIGSPGSGETIAAFGERQDVVLSFEPSPAKAVAGEEGVLLSAAGTSEVSIKVEGRAAHAGAAPEQGRNALIELAYQLVQTRDVAKQVKGAELNWTTASAGTVRNQIPQAAQAGGDVRVTEPDANDQLLAALKAKVEESRLIPDTTTTVTLQPMRPIYIAGAKGQRLADLARSIYAEIDGRRLQMLPTTNGGTDAGFAGRSGHPMVLESLGLAGWGYHAKNEYIEIDSIPPRLYLTSRMLIELGKGPLTTSRTSHGAVR